MTNSRSTVSIPIAVALKLRMDLHWRGLLATALVPMLIYYWLIYRDVSALHKFDLPVDCILSGYDHQPWWMIPPGLISIGGVLLYCVIVWLFYDRKNESGIVNLVRKNINSDEMIEFKI